MATSVTSMTSSLPTETSGPNEVRSAPEPNPPFVFPARPSNPIIPCGEVPSVADRSSVGPVHNLVKQTSTIARPIGWRKTPENLPVFNFAAVDAASPSSVPSQPSSPTRSLPPGSRTIGHRRSSSEFIGGDGRPDGPGLMSTSPTTLQPPVHLGPPANRRGHAHRRSGAISCHDLSLIKNGPEGSVAARAGSAPTSPAEVDGFGRDMFPASPVVNSPPGRSSAAKDDRGAPRARVGFSDTLEFIPRPLSTLSSDTSSTQATIRASHSLSGSISSLASVRAASVATVESSSQDAAPSTETYRPRPNTAGAIMSGVVAAAGRFDSQHAPALKRSKSVASTSEQSLEATVAVDGSPKKRGRHRIQPSRSAPILPRVDLSRILDDGSRLIGLTTSAPAASTATAVSDDVAVDKVTDEGVSHSVHKSERHGGKRKRRVKMWAGTILSRKARHRHQKQKSNTRRISTPPPPASQSLPDEANLDLDFADDRICTVVSPSLTDYIPPPMSGGVLASSPDLASSPTLANMCSPMIDLDAALGPFNTPDLGPQFGHASKGGFSAAKRRMHSSGVTGGFSGPGMHYHRRAESAPEMAAFEYGRAALHRLGSSSTMADVFEEDEEEDPSTESSPRQRSEDGERSSSGGIGIGIDVDGSDELVTRHSTSEWVEATESSQSGIKRHGSGLSDNGRRQALASAQPVRRGSSTERLSPMAPNGVVEIADDEEPPRAPSVTKSSDSTLTPPLSHAMTRREASPIAIDLAAPMPPYLTPDTPSLTNSSFPSPDFARGSFDVPRALTAASSFTDDHVPSSLMMGEPGPELRISVDDVPSLISSSSTMTSAVNYTGPYSVYGDDRARANRASMSSSALSGRPRSRRFGGPKRASLVSLSRLVGGSHGEKSKLSIEEKAQPEAAEKTGKESKGKRISRLIHFWKAKESS